MKVAIRADASTVIGVGHVMRCLALADELVRDGAVVSFLCWTDSGNLTKLLRKRGFDVVLLSNGRPRETTADIEATRTALRAESPDWLILDHYEFDAASETQLRDLVKKIMVIDDLADREHDCDVLLDQNYFPNADRRYDGLVSGRCRLLLGPRYALLRGEFRVARNSLRRETGPARKVLVSFGGTDPTRETEKALDALALLGRSDIGVDVVVGSPGSATEGFEARRGEVPGLRVHHGTNEMAKLMSEADIAIGAGGSTNWERCCLGLPALVVSVAANQGPIATALADLGAIAYLGESAEVTAERMVARFRDIASSMPALEMMSRAGMQLVDGAGASRVTELLRSTQ
jgi:UDP-2,4-diacetamido-2,4,6-trideoxy-beta-L-altropyranose hydrolase